MWFSNKRHQIFVLFDWKIITYKDPNKLVETNNEKLLKILAMNATFARMSTAEPETIKTRTNNFVPRPISTLRFYLKETRVDATNENKCCEYVFVNSATYFQGRLNCMISHLILLSSQKKALQSKLSNCRHWWLSQEPYYLMIPLFIWTVDHISTREISNLSNKVEYHEQLEWRSNLIDFTRVTD